MIQLIRSSSCRSPNSPQAWYVTHSKFTSKPRTREISQAFSVSLLFSQEHSFHLCCLEFVHDKMCKLHFQSEAWLWNFSVRCLLIFVLMLASSHTKSNSSKSVFLYVYRGQTRSICQALHSHSSKWTSADDGEIWHQKSDMERDVSVLSGPSGGKPIAWAAVKIYFKFHLAKALCAKLVPGDKWSEVKLM